MSAWAVIVAAGRGARMGAPINKVFLTVGGITVLRRCVEAVSASEAIEGIVVVASAQDLERARGDLRGCEKVREIVAGGGTRQDSVWNGLCVLGADCDIVLVHDGARAGVTPELVGRCVEAVRRYGACVACVPVSDTIKIVDSGSVVRTLDRASLMAAQTPQGFRRRDLVAAYEWARANDFLATDDASLLEHIGRVVRVIEGNEGNWKLTTPGDWARMRAGEGEAEKGASPSKAPEDATDGGMMGKNEDDVASASDRTGTHPGDDAMIDAARAAIETDGESTSSKPDAARPAPPETRVGQGFDAHRLVPDRHLILCGVEIPFDKGLLGHSDADVATHALIDALLGAACLGDIGMLFPDSDARYRGADSIELLRRVVSTLADAGWKPGNVDVTIIAQRPKILPHRDAMRARLAEALDLPLDAVNVKGKTTEGMGFAGKGVGMAAMAVAMIARAARE